MPMDPNSARGKWVAKAVQSRSDAASTRNLVLAALLTEIADTYEHLAELPSTKIDAMIEKDIPGLKDLSRRTRRGWVELPGNG